MKKHIDTIILAVFACLAISCSSYSPAKELSYIADDLECNSENYTTEDWENVIQQYKSVLESMADYECSDEERLEIGRQQGRCLAYLTKGYAKIAAKKSASFLNQLKGVVEGFEESFGDGRDVTNDILKAFDGLLDEE